MSGAGYVEILSRLQAPQLRMHCDDALCVELAKVQHDLHGVRAAMLRLQDVGNAARTLGKDEAAMATPAIIEDLKRLERELGRAARQFGVKVDAFGKTQSFVCCQCHGTEMKVSTEEEMPLLARPDTAALSPPRRPTLRTRKLTTRKMRKLVTKRMNASAVCEVVKKKEVAVKAQPKPLVTPAVVKEEEDDDAGDVRTRLSRQIDVCWPLATSLGALELHQRRSADYVTLVNRVSRLFHVLHACDADEMASRSMRSVIVKARDSLAVAVSLLNLHEVTLASAPLILVLVRAVDAASEKHKNLQKHIAPFRDSLAELEVLLLTNGFVRDSTTNSGRAVERQRV